MKKTITRLAFLLAVVLLFPGRSCTFSSWEKRVVRQQDSVLYVTTLWQDSTILRTPSTNLSHRELQSAVLQTLEAKMLRTVMDPSQDGVGIAAPQVGINRRVVWVQRLDKEGEPFECYENIQIDSLFGETVLLEEGCLSVPPLRGRVPRSSGVVVSYLRDGKRVTETIWTASCTSTGPIRFSPTTHGRPSGLHLTTPARPGGKRCQGLTYRLPVCSFIASIKAGA